MKARSSPEQLRRAEIVRVRNDLEQQGFPRLKMMLLVGLTGGSGFLASYLLLHGGVTAMSSRYPLAVGIAYLVFLFLLWLWLRSKAEDYADLPGPDGTGSGGGRCHGDGPVDSGGMVDTSSGDAVLSDSDLGDVAEVVSGADELAIPLLALLALAGLVFASGWIVYSAPLLFAELLVDGVLSASLYRRLRGIESRHWLETAIRRTWAPFLITGLVCWAAALAMHAIAPEAQTLGAFIHRNDG